MQFIVKTKSLRAFNGILITLLFVILSTTLFAQKVKNDKKAETLLQNAAILADSAKYDSAVILVTEASLIYKKKRNTEKYIHCKNEIVRQLRNVKFNDELLNAARQNVFLAISELGPLHFITGNSYSLLGNIFADINKTDSALFYFNKAKEIWAIDAKKNKMRIASVNLNIGQMLRNMGDFKNAATLINSALITKIDSLGENHPDVAAIFNALGSLYYHKGDVDSCTICFTKVLEIRNKCYGETHPQVANAYNNLGVAYKINGNFEKALSFYLKALEIREKNYTTAHPNLALSYSNIGVIYSDLGKYNLAKEYYEKALKMRLELFGENHLDVAACYTNLGINCMDCGEGGSAILYTQKAFKIIIDNYGNDNPNSSSAYNNMGAAYVYGLGDLDKALKYFVKGLELRKKTNPNNPLLASSYNNIGAVYKDKGDYALAISYYKNSLNVLTPQFGESHEEVASAFNNMGEAYLGLNQGELALDFFKKALGIRIELFGESYPELSNTYLNIGAAYSMLGNLEKEKESYEKGLEICLKNFDDKNISAAILYLNLALNAKDSKDYPTALSLVEKALKIQTDLYKKDHPDIAKSLADFGLIYSLTADYELAAQYYKRALDEDYIGDLSDSIDYQYVLDEVLFLESLTSLAELYLTKYQINKNESSLHQSLGYFQKASDMVSFLTYGYGLDASKLNLLKNTASFFEKALSAAALLYHKRKSAENFAMAFSLSEQNKASLLYESMIKTQLDFNESTDSLWLLQKDLKGKINYLKTNYIDLGDDSDCSSTKNKLDVELAKSIVEYQQLYFNSESKILDKKL
ncbi:MAG: tetratricopeptide repeat protein, partial [Bacteroidales bacterium]|nr:tetratricopeptide repeat protein [Bacteroidales bacterium]